MSRLRVFNLRIALLLIALCSTVSYAGKSDLFIKHAEEMIANGERDGAYVAIEHRASKNSRDFPLQYFYARMLIDDGEFPRAISIAEQAMAHGADGPEPYIIIVEAYEGASSIVPAKSKINGGVMLFPKNKVLRRYKAKLDIILALKQLSEYSPSFASLMIGQVDSFFADNIRGVKSSEELLSVRDMLIKYNKDQSKSIFNLSYFSSDFVAMYPEVINAEKRSYPYEIANSKLRRYGGVYLFSFQKSGINKRTVFEISNDKMKITDIKTIAVDN